MSLRYVQYIVHADNLVRDDKFSIYCAALLIALIFCPCYLQRCSRPAHLQAGGVQPASRQWEQDPSLSVCSVCSYLACRQTAWGNPHLPQPRSAKLKYCHSVLGDVLLKQNFTTNSIPTVQPVPKFCSDSVCLSGRDIINITCQISDTVVYHHSFALKGLS